MAKVLNKLYSRLSRIYKLDSPIQAPSTLDISSPVQPVHDVSGAADAEAARLALPGSSIHGFRDNIMQLGLDWAEAGAGTVYNTLSVDGQAEGTYGLDLTRYGLIMDYLTAVEVAGNPAATIIQAWLAGGNQPGLANEAPVFIFSAGARLQYTAGGNYTYPPRLNGALTPLYYRHLPMQVPRYATIYLRAAFGAAGTIRFLAGFRIFTR